MNLFEPLEFSRKKLIRPDQATRVHELAKKILAKIGIKILNEAVLEQIKKMGLHYTGSRVLFEPVVVEEYLSDMRRRIAIQSEPVPENDHLKLYVNSYSMFVHDPDTDQVVKYATPRLIEMTKLMDSLAGDGVLNAPPGFPMDEPPDLQPIAQYRIAALYARQGASPVDPTSVRTVDYLMEMAEVMGEPVTHLYVWVPTPLRLGGESLDVVLACHHQLSSISVGSMPCAGATAPLSLWRLSFSICRTDWRDDCRANGHWEAYLLPGPFNSF